MKYILSKEILGEFPTICLGIIAVRGIDNSKNNPEILALLRSAESEIRQAFSGITLSEHPMIK
ncbi:hypothetical protein HYX09_04685, partial [Candidatus Woesearchaeota archaeon]|nr:hypothetical protein [Candidatus Woesearchaeota archaeon]